ncbi:hypothetical protein [Pseudoxanthomonas sp. X-1]|uniref:hypothetical protein n=1 Tax=Pseudoxanthomonas sp. X-1 TaxID=2571115 RepID=UPI00110A2C1D|nr:hypothetical protein [Pseudoxanthomonas sp. X-1]TMN18465.1 hypothetical protein FF950_14370 [Pseudoxanthomonas sp. X-1]UAY76034.1 hypothetical protein LAJ50_07305 [Pseudoxanthomonas sp. X-1]
MTTPPLPPGFVLDEPPPLEIEIKGGRRASQATPPLPEGFELETPGTPPAANNSAFARMISGESASQEGGFLRDLGMSARSVIQGAGGLLGSVGDAFNHYLVPGDQPSYREAASALADRIGLPSPQTKQERILGDIGEALTGTGLTMGVGGLLNAGRQAVSAAAPTGGQLLGDFLTAQPVLQTVSSATGAGAGSMARENGAGVGGQLAASLLGGLAPGAVTTLPAMTARGALRGGESSRKALADAISDFSVLGSTPSVGQGTGAWSRQGAESLLAAGPTSAGVIGRFADRQSEELGTGLRALADGLYRNPSAERAGRAIEQGIRGDGGFIKTSRERADQLYGLLDQQIAPDSRVGVSNVRQALADLNAEIPGAPSVSRFFQNARLQGIEGALAQDAGGIEGALSRPNVRAEADRIRQELNERAAVRRAELAQEAQMQRGDLVAEAGNRRDTLMAEAQLKRERLENAAEEMRVNLYSERQAALERNARARALNMNNFEPVLSDAEIEARIPTRASIEAQIPTREQIEAQVTPLAAIEQITPSPAAYNDPQFGQDYIEGQVRQYLESQIDDKLPYEAVQKLRTLVGNELESTSLASDIPRSKWRAVYAALSKDMEASATTPEAQKALARANAYFNARSSRIDAIDRIIDRNGGPEKIFGAVMGGTRDGGTTLRAVMQSLPEEGQKAITSAAIRRMGMANPGAQDAAGEAFSAATFLTNWNKVSPEARRAMFDRFGPGFSADLDKVAKVAERIKDSAGVLANASGSAAKGAGVGYWGSLTASLLLGRLETAAGLAAAGATANGMARAMTNPRIVKWLAKNTEVPAGAFAAQLQTLRNIGKNNNDPGVTEFANELASTAEQAKQNPEDRRRQGDQ